MSNIHSLSKFKVRILVFCWLTLFKTLDFHVMAYFCVHNLHHCNFSYSGCLLPTSAHTISTSAGLHSLRQPPPCLICSTSAFLQWTSNLGQFFNTYHTCGVRAGQLPLMFSVRGWLTCMSKYSSRTIGMIFWDLLRFCFEWKCLPHKIQAARLCSQHPMEVLRHFGDCRSPP